MTSPGYTAGVQDTVTAAIDFLNDLRGHQLSTAVEYMCDPEDAMHSLEQDRAEAVQKLLVGAQVDTAELATLGYEIDAWHIGLIAAGEGANKVMRDLAARLNRQLLTVQQLDETLWVWLGGKGKLTASDVERRLSNQPTTSVAVVIGEPGRGISGWRLTHNEADVALRVALQGPRRVVRCADVPLEAAVLGDETLLHLLKTVYLGPLDDLRDGGRAIRATLRTYFNVKCNVAATAGRMGIGERTVRYRLQKAAERLGYDVSERHAELEIALRVEKLCEAAKEY